MNEFPSNMPKWGIRQKSFCLIHEIRGLDGKILSN